MLLHFRCSQTDQRPRVPFVLQVLVSHLHQLGNLVIRHLSQLTKLLLGFFRLGVHLYLLELVLHRGGWALLQSAFQTILEALFEFAVLLLGQFLHLENGVEVNSVN